MEQYYPVLLWAVGLTVVITFLIKVYGLVSNISTKEDTKAIATNLKQETERIAGSVKIETERVAALISLEFHRLIENQYKKLEALSSISNRIEIQTTATNGRVSSLENRVTRIERIEDLIVDERRQNENTSQKV